MIETNELRRNNLLGAKIVNPAGETISVRSGAVTKIDENSVWLNEVRFRKQDITPIPLTPEWLERGGFERRPPDEDYEYWGIENFTLLYGRMVGGNYGFFLNGYHNDCHIETVHHLQNVFYVLRGAELEIKPL